MVNSMSINEILHILRNPYGHVEDEIREARLAACNEIERLQRIELWYNGMREFIKP